MIHEFHESSGLAPVRAWLLAASCVALLFAPCRAGAAPPRAVEAAKSAAAICKGGDAAEAAAALSELVAVLEAEFGATHTATELAEMTLANLEGRAFEPRPSGEEKPEPPSPDLSQALKGLRACAALSHRRAQDSRATLGFAESLEEAGELYRKGRYREALGPAERALQAARGGLEIMRANETLAGIRLLLGDREGALRAAQDAEGAALLVGGVKVRIKLARLVAQTGDLARAAALLDELEPLAENDPDARAEFHEARGDLALLLGSPSAAVLELERARAMHAEIYGEESASTAAVLQLLGDGHRLARDFPAASKAYREALRVRREQLGTTHPDAARTENAIGVLHADFEDWAAADAAFASALGILGQTLGPQHPETLTVRLNRVRAAWGRTQSDANATQYAAAVEALGEVLGEDHPETAAALRNLARVEAERGRLKRAQALLDRALAAQRRSLGETHPETTFTRLERGRLLARSGKLEAAAEEVGEATTSLASVLGSEHPLVARYRTELARIAIARGDAAMARAEGMEAARVVTLHVNRSFGAMTGRQRTLLARQSLEVVGALLSTPGGSARETYQTLLPHRDSVLRSIAASQAVARERDPETRAILAALIRKRESYVASVLGETPEMAERAAKLAAEIDALEAAAAEAGVRVSERTAAQVLEAACKRLPGDAALVEFVAYDRTVRGAAGTATPSLTAWLTRSPGCRVTAVELGKAGPIEAAAERFDRAMRESRLDEPAARIELSQLLLAPLVDELRGATRWFVVPDGRLWGVPLGALPDPENQTRYLLERVTVGYLTSVYELAEAPAEVSGSDLSKALLFGAPDFGDGAESGPVILTNAGPCALPPFEPLPATVAEIREIEPLLADSRIITGAEATKSRFQKELSRRPVLIHLATHGYFAEQGGCGSSSPAGAAWRDGSDPVEINPLLLSGVAFAGANSAGRIGSGAASGILTAYEVAGLDLRQARLVVLSACDTGAGSRERGQEVQGLRWGFRAAGAHALVTSLWRSNDVATRKLMSDFYRALSAGGIPSDGFRGAEALRRAQLERIRDEQRLKLRKPLVWANFVFSGVL
jgi:CHAT domain-containing protein/tetratricopeptide (TPR) repeat protein